MLPPTYGEHIRTPSTESWHMLTTYIVCPFDLEFRPIFTKIALRYPEYKRLFACL